MGTQPISSREPDGVAEIDYAKTVQRLSRDLEYLLECSSSLKLQNSLALIDDVVARMRDHRFTVAVVGEFKTGKSTFVNALLGVDVVPTDVLPATATLNRITFGLTPAIEVVYKDGRRDKVAFDELSKYVTKEHVTDDLLQRVDEVIIQYQAPYLLNNVDIVDTPGLNDEDAMTAVTLSVLPKTDAAILVISAMAPLSEYTRDFLENKLLSADLGRVIFVVNRIGQLGGTDDADKLIRHIEQRIAEKVVERARTEYGAGSAEFETYVKKIGKPRVFGIDSYQALHAQLHGESELLQRSRFTVFAAGLRKFLNEDRGAVVLQVPINRALASAGEILLAMEMRRNALRMSAGEFEKKFEEAGKQLERLAERRRSELAAVEEKQTAALAACLPRADGVQDRIVEAMKQAVESFELTDHEVSSGGRQQEAIEKLKNTAQTAARRQAEKELQEITALVNRSLAEASGKAQEFTAHVDEVLRHIATDFQQVEAEGENIGAVAAGLTGAVLGGGLSAFGGIWSGYKQAGWAGAVTGGIASVTTATLAAMLLVAAGAPLTLPVWVGVSLLGWFSGDKTAKYVFGGARARSFKDHFQAKLAEYVRGQKIEEQMRTSIETYVHDSFTSLKDTISRETEALIENTRRTLDDLNSKKQRQEITTAEELENYAEMAEKVKSIRDFAGRINAALVQRLAV
jgi:GTPase SAR1 family protein